MVVVGRSEGLREHILEFTKQAACDDAQRGGTLLHANTKVGALETYRQSLHNASLLSRGCNASDSASRLCDVDYASMTFPMLDWLNQIYGTAMTVSCVIGGALVIYFFIWLCGCRFRIRNIACIRRCLRLTGVDRFDDFELETIVHELQYPGRISEKRRLSIRIVAGRRSVQTETSNDGKFYETLGKIVVEQGVESVDVCLCDSSGRVSYRRKLDPVKELLALSGEELVERDVSLREKVGPDRGMKLGHKVTVKLTFRKPGEDCRNSVVQRAIAEGKELDISTQLHLDKVAAAVEPGADELRVLSRACAGPVELTEHHVFRTWKTGKIRHAWLAALGPPTERKWILGLWPDEHAWQDGKTGEMEFEVLSTSGVSPDPHSANIFGIRYISGNIRKELRLGHVDRSRDVWVECLQLLIERVHQAAKDKKGHRESAQPSREQVA